MLISGPGTFHFILREVQHDESASVSAREAATVKVFHNDVLIDLVHVGKGATHSWWNSNPLLRSAQAGDSVKIAISGDASMRIDWNLEPTP